MRRVRAWWRKGRDGVQTAAEPIAPEPVKTEVIQPMRRTYTEEIIDGGWRGAFGIDQFDWQGSVGTIWQIHKLSPCCGDPPNGPDAAHCIATWTCCTFCAFTKMYGTSLGPACGLVPHVVFAYCCPFCAAAFMRYNIRYDRGIEGNLMGDCVCSVSCLLCSMLQMLRAVKREDWDLWPCEFVPVAPEMRLIV